MEIGNKVAAVWTDDGRKGKDGGGRGRWVWVRLTAQLRKGGATRRELDKDGFEIEW